MAELGLEPRLSGSRDLALTTILSHLSPCTHHPLALLSTPTCPSMWGESQLFSAAAWRGTREVTDLVYQLCINARLRCGSPERFCCSVQTLAPSRPVLRSLPHFAVGLALCHGGKGGGHSICDPWVPFLHCPTFFPFPVLLSTFPIISMKAYPFSSESSPPWVLFLLPVPTRNSKHLAGRLVFDSALPHLASFPLPPSNSSASFCFL